MATGLEVYDALKRATADLTVGTPWVIHRFDFIDLQKLNVRDLESRDYDRGVAADVVRQLERGEIAEFSKSLGLRLTVSSLGQPLVEGIPSQLDREQQLWEKLNSPQGRDKLIALFQGYLPSTDIPTSDAAIIDAILQVEYAETLHNH